MPELPDLSILTDALHASTAGRRLVAVATPQAIVLRATQAELQALESQTLLSVTRRGKFLTFQFDRDRLVINPMLTGRLGLAREGERPLAHQAMALQFEARQGPPPKMAPWTRRARWRPPDHETLQLRYRDATRMGKIYLIPRDTPRAIPGWDEQGPDADDPSLDLAIWRRRIARYRGQLKPLLRNQAFVAGIGNAYSDEILWAARLSPFRARSDLAADEVDQLYHATRDVLTWAIGELRKRVPPTFEREVRDMLRVHRKGGAPCPRCGAPISEISPGGFVTSYCRVCQR